MSRNINPKKNIKTFLPNDDLKLLQGCFANNLHFDSGFFFFFFFWLHDFYFIGVKEAIFPELLVERFNSSS